ncbi:MAG TPA: oligosaccharide flippase family protein [bacterium]|nr:oligosaccharide flippase family protein [bacterium]
MSSLPALVRNSLVLLAGTAASKALVFVSTLVLVRSLPAEGFGLYTLVFAWLSFFELLPDAGLDMLAVREAQTPGARRARVLGDALVARAVLIAAAAPAAALLAPLAADDPAIAALAALGALSWLSSFRRASLRSLLDLPYRVALRMEIPALLGTLAEAAHLAVLPFALGAAGVAGAVAAQGLSHLPFALLLAALSFRRIRPELRPAPQAAVATLRRTAPLFGLLLANAVLARVDVLMLQALRGSREVGIYAAPVRLVEVANLLPILLMASVYPLLAAAARDPERVERLFRGSLRFLSAVIAPVIVVEIAFAGPLVHLFFGAEYSASAAVLPALAAAELLIFADIVMNARFVATGLEKRNLQLVAAAAVANVAANFVLIPAHGAAGAALATLLAYAVRVGAAALSRETRAAGRGALAAVLPAAAAGAAAWAVLTALGPATPGGIAAGAATYAAVLAALRGLRPEDLRQIRRALRPGER